MKNIASASVIVPAFSAWLLLASVGVVQAEDPNAPPPDQTGDPVMQPADGQQPVYQEQQQQQQQQPVYQDQQQQPQYQDPQYQDPNQQPVQVVEEEETAEGGRGIQYGAHLVLPIFLADNSAALDPGIGIGVQGRIGWEFGAGLSIELQIGIMYNPASSDDRTSTYSGYGMTDIWLGGGLRYSFLNETAIVPFVGAGIGVNLWGNTFSDGSGTTTSTGNSVPTFGANGNVGVQIEISPYIGLEAGAQLNWNTDPGSEIGARPILWLSPFLGGTLYF